jgi:hypothetical protein
MTTAVMQVSFGLFWRAIPMPLFKKAMSDNLYF